MTTIKELMTPHPQLIHPESTMHEAAKKMREFTCGCLIAGIDEKPKGMLTDRDIVVWGLAEGLEPDRATVSEIMTPGVITCYEDKSVEEAADLMADRDVRRLVVVNRQDKVVGVLSIADMVKCSDSDVVNDNVIHHLFKYA